MTSPPSEDFNPYHEWLGIPVEEQPADYYRLLGLPRFEHNERVIANAYDQKMYFLRSKQLGHFVQLSQKLQNEITAAQRVLLNPAQRSTYDAQLTEATRSPPPAAPEQISASPPIFVSSTLSKRKIASKKTTMPLVGFLGLICGFIAIASITGLLVVSEGDPGRFVRGKPSPHPTTSTKSGAAPQTKRAAASTMRRETVDRQSVPESPPKAVALPVVPSKWKDDYSLRFDGIDDRVDLPNLHYKGEFPLTLEAWACLKRGADENILECLICDFENGGMGLATQLSFNPPRPYKWGCSAFAGGYRYAAEREPIPRDALIHLAGVFVPNNQVRFYVNGKLQSSTTVSASFKPSVFPLVVGANPQPRGGTFESFFAGEISALRISSIARHVNDFTPERHFPADANTLALYRFEEGAGDQLIDSSGHGYHGKIVGATWVKSRPVHE